jgi:hypothetical protein
MVTDRRNDGSHRLDDNKRLVRLDVVVTARRHDMYAIARQGR